VVEATESQRSQRNLTHQPCTELRKVSRAVYASRFGSFARGTVGRRCFAFSADAAPTLHCALRCWVVADAHLVSMQHLNSFVEFLGLQGYVGRSRVDVQIVV
jgi:hypothetical protein